MEKNITLGELIDDINSSTEYEYTFLRVLHEKDQVLFLSRLSDEYYNEIFKTKKIMFSVWLNIMKRKGNLEFSADYKIYRKAYVGESIGKKYIVEEYSNKVVLMNWIGKFETKTYFELIQNFISNKQFEYRPVICILLHKNKMENFDFKTSKYAVSSLVNNNYKFKDDLF